MIVVLEMHVSKSDDEIEHCHNNTQHTRKSRTLVFESECICNVDQQIDVSTIKFQAILIGLHSFVVPLHTIVRQTEVVPDLGVGFYLERILQILDAIVDFVLRLNQCYAIRVQQINVFRVLFDLRRFVFLV
jgi:hypothetical protein